MILTNTINETRSFCTTASREGSIIGFVPTMGALHKGHLSLVSEARKYCDTIVMSIFVNPIQFDNSSDFTTYPQPISEDIEKAREAGVSCLFHPSADEMYNNQKTFIDQHTLCDHLCGAAREGHFTGVLTVVTKLFNIVTPDYAFFGQKDIQQARAIQKMCADLNMPLTIIISPIVRDHNGLALSSRNIHLSDREKKRALSLYNALCLADRSIKEGERDSSKLIEMMRTLILSDGAPEKIDYLSIVDYENLQPVPKLEQISVIAVAAVFGTTRLIDNAIVAVEGGVTCTY